MQPPLVALLLLSCVAGGHSQEYEESEVDSSPGNTALGVLLQVFISDVLIVLGLGIQKLALMNAEALNATAAKASSVAITATATEDEDEGEPSKGNGDTDHGSLCSLVQNWQWLLGLALFAIGQLVEVTALSFTSQVNITALSTLKLGWNALVAMKLFGEPFSLYPIHGAKERWWLMFYQWDLFTYTVMISGAIIIVFCSPPQPPDDTFDAGTLSRMFIETPFVFFGAVMWTAMGVSIVLVVFFVRSGETSYRGAYLIGNLAAMTSAISLTLAKVTTTLLTKLLQGDNQYSDDPVSTSILTVAYAVCVVSVLVLLNVGLKRFEQALFYPIYEILGCLYTITVGILYFKTYDNDDQGPAKWFGFFFGLFLLIAGVVLSSFREKQQHEVMQERLQGKKDVWKRRASDLRNFSSTDGGQPLLLADGEVGAGAGQSYDGHRRGGGVSGGGGASGGGGVSGDELNNW